MKYNVTINQLVLHQSGLDFIDAAILDYLVSYCNSLNDKVDFNRLTDAQGRKWTWIDYATLISDMPMLGINNKAPLSRRIKKIEAAGYIITKRGLGYKLYVRLSDNVDKLYFTQMSVAKKQHLIEESALLKSNTSVAKKQHIINTIYSNTNNTNTKLAKPNSTKLSTNVDKHVDTPEHISKVISKKYLQDPLPAIDSVQTFEIEDTPAVNKDIVDKKIPITTAHQAYGEMVITNLNLDANLTARVMKAVKGKTLYKIEDAMKKTEKYTKGHESADRAKYFFKCLTSP